MGRRNGGKNVLPAAYRRGGGHTDAGSRCPFINAAAEYPDPGSRIRRVVAEHRAWFRGALEEAAAGRDNPADIAASLVLLRDAALVGRYLDGIETVEPAFVRSARQAAGITGLK